MFAIVLAAEGVDTAEVVLAFFTGGVAGALVTAILGPFAVQRAARNETYREWQVDLSTEFLEKLAELRPLLKGAQNPDAREKKVTAETALGELDTLAQRVKLIFPDESGAGAPYWAGKAAEEARKKGVDLDEVDKARNGFVQCASNEIRSRGMPRTFRRIWGRREREKNGSRNGESVESPTDSG